MLFRSLDGNRKNNDPKNLLCVSIEEHLKIHKNQEDWGAVQAILSRMENREGITEAASKFQKQKLIEGTHNFQIMTKKRRIEISKKTIKKRLSEGNGAFLGIEDTVENSRLARSKMSREMELLLQKKMVDKVRGTYWWTNIETGERIRAKKAPNKKWKRGMIK